MGLGKEIRKGLSKIGPIAGLIAALPFGGKTAKWRKAAQSMASLSGTVAGPSTVSDNKISQVLAGIPDQFKRFGGVVLDESGGFGGVASRFAFDPSTGQATVKKASSGPGRVTRVTTPGSYEASVLSMPSSTGAAGLTGVETLPVVYQGMQTLPALASKAKALLPFATTLATSAYNAYKSRYGTRPEDDASKKALDLVERGYHHLRTRQAAGQTPTEYYPAPDPEPLPDDSSSMPRARQTSGTAHAPGKAYLDEGVVWDDVKRQPRRRKRRRTYKRRRK